jgi:hypothetical protein
MGEGIVGAGLTASTPSRGSPAQTHTQSPQITGKSSKLKYGHARKVYFCN